MECSSWQQRKRLEQTELHLGHLRLDLVGKDAEFGVADMDEESELDEVEELELAAVVAEVDKVFELAEAEVVADRVFVLARVVAVVADKEAELEWVGVEEWAVVVLDQGLAEDEGQEWVEGEELA